MQTAPGDDPNSVFVELWVSDGTMPRVHGYIGTRWLVRDADDQFWQLDQAQIDEEPPSFPIADRPSAHCTPLGPAPGASVRCGYRLERAIPRGVTVHVSSVGPLPLGGRQLFDCELQLRPLLDEAADAANVERRGEGDRVVVQHRWPRVGQVAGQEDQQPAQRRVHLAVA